MNPLKQADPDVWNAIQGERRRQQDGLEMIASENYTSPAVMSAQGSVLTNKYAEGLPGKRYYGGCEFVDVVERLAIERCLKLFGAERANVQAHSGAQANMAVFLAALQPGDTILGLDLAHGGHLTHGMRLNFSGKYFHVVSYGVRRDTECIDFDQLAAQAREHKPKLVIAGASAYPRQIDFAKFAEIAKKVGAILMVDMAHIAGLVAAGLIRQVAASRRGDILILRPALRFEALEFGARSISNFSRLLQSIGNGSHDRLFNYRPFR